MHRHGYKGRKLSRERDERLALLKSLASSLIDQQSIVTTLPKAKETRPYLEKLITKAKKNTLHARRQVIAALANEESAHKLVDEIAPLLSRDSGYLRISTEPNRRGDGAPMARIEFVDDITSLQKTKQPATTKQTVPKKESPKKDKS